jgi:hypothetical protein
MSLLPSALPLPKAKTHFGIAGLTGPTLDALETAAGLAAARFATVRGAATGLRGDETALRVGTFFAPAAVFASLYFFAPAATFRPLAFFMPAPAFGPVVFLTARNALPAARALREGFVGFAIMMSHGGFRTRQSMLGMALQALPSRTPTYTQT